MLKSEERRKEITARLSILTYYIKNCNKQGLTDANKEAEDFFCGLLNIVFGTSLENMNYIKRDYPAIDLGDREEALAIQVTSTNSREKIEHTLAEFFKHEQDRIYNQLIILIIGEKVKYRKKFQVKRRFPFDPDRDVWDTATLCDEIMKMDTDRQEEVIRYLEANMVIPEPTPKQPEPETYTPPVSGEKRLKNYLPETLGADGFKGRERERELLAQALERREKPIFITGLGGIGKTELAIRFCQDRQDQFKVHFVRFAGTFEDTVTQGIALGVENLYLSESRPKEQIYHEVMRVLEDCDSSTILIIDNADPADGNFNSLKDETYRKLCRMNLRLIITTRAAVPGGVKAKRMSNADLREIIGRYAEISEADADALIDAVDGHTLTVDLMGRAMQPGWKRVTPAMLLDALHKNVLADAIGKTVTTDYNRDQQQESQQKKIHEHLRTVFNVVGIPEEAKQVMCCATLLPEAGMNAELFESALPADVRETLEDLTKRAWLRVNNANMVTIHPVVRLICFEALKPTDEICRAFLETLWGNYDKKAYDHDLYSTMAELYTTAAEQLENERGGWSGRGRALWHKVGQNEKALVCAKMTVKRRESIFPIDDLDLADAYNDMGLVYQNLGNNQGMEDYYRKALEIRKRILKADHLDLAKSYNNVGVVYERKGDFQTALTYKLQALLILKRILPEYDLDLATSYQHVGDAYYLLDDLVNALDYQKKSIEIREKVLDVDHPVLASSYGNIGNTYCAIKDYQTALQYHQKALKIREKVLPAYHLDFSYSYSNIGGIYAWRGDRRIALEYMDKALRIRERSLSIDHSLLADSYHEIGWVHYLDKKYELALEYYKKAMDIREKVLTVDHPYLAATYNNMGCTYGACENYTLAFEYLEKALRIREIWFPSGHPEIQLVKDNIAYYKNKSIRNKWMDQIN